MKYTEKIEAYNALKEQIKILERQHDELKAEIMGMLGDIDKRVIDNAYEIERVITPTESFKLKDALKAIKREILESFITKSQRVNLYIRRVA